jgi:deoxyribonuclease V
MITLHHAHPWNITPAEAIQIQEELHPLVKQTPLPDEGITYIGGLDASFSSGAIYAVAVVLDYHSQQIVEKSCALIAATFPYIAGFLSFREAPAILEALSQLKCIPDVLIVDGHGLAHPHRFGIASHLGVLLDIPTIGCAKSVLVGQSETLGDSLGSYAMLVDRGEVVGAALRTCQAVKPVYVSVGHRVDLESVLRIVMSCCRGFRLPEPARLAHQLTGLSYRRKHSEILSRR